MGVHTNTHIVCMRCSIVIRTEGQQQDNHAGDDRGAPRTEQTNSRPESTGYAVGTGTSFSISGDLTGLACCTCTVPHAASAEHARVPSVKRAVVHTEYSVRCTRRCVAVWECLHTYWHEPQVSTTYSVLLVIRPVGPITDRRDVNEHQSTDGSPCDSDHFRWSRWRRRRRRQGGRRARFGKTEAAINSHENVHVLHNNNIITIMHMQLALQRYYQR